MSAGDLGERVVAALERVLPGVSKPVALHEPCFDGTEWDRVKECLDSGWVSSLGGLVGRFEDMLAEVTGAAGVVATVNGTAALHSCLVLAGVRPGDEVLVPAVTFVATANAVAYCGAIPHLVDCEPRSLGVDAGKLSGHLADVADNDGEGIVNRATGRPIRALLVTHVFGHPADMDALGAVCVRFGLELIEDAAEALGSYSEDRHAGTCSRLAALSFNGNKIVTTGGGGAVLTDDAELAARARHLTTTARVEERWEFVHDQVGYNYRLPNLNAALGCAQLERLPYFLEAKRRLADRYRETFDPVDGVAVLAEPAYARSNYWLNALVLDRTCADERDRVLAAAQAAGFLCRPLWRPMHLLPMYRDCPRMDLATAEDMYRRVIALPSSAFLGTDRSGK